MHGECRFLDGTISVTGTPLYFNLSYQTKVFELTEFLQEKIAQKEKALKDEITSCSNTCWGISSIYDSLADKNPNDDSLDEIDGHKSDNSE